MICDGKAAFIGTINLDYRSLFLHFECGVCLYDTPCIADMEKDFSEVLEKSREITPEFCSSLPLFTRLMQKLLKIIAPLM